MSSVGPSRDNHVIVPRDTAIIQGTRRTPQNIISTKDGLTDKNDNRYKENQMLTENEVPQNYIVQG